jgi:hypothetical protein
VPKLCKPVLNAKQFEDRGTVTGISISRKSEDEPGYVITAKVTVDGVNSPLNISTPYLTRPSEHTGEFAYREGLFEVIDELEEQALVYVRSRRPSLDLFAAENGRRKVPEPTPIEAEARAQAVRAACIAVLPKKVKGPQFGDDDHLALYIADAWEDRATDFEGVEYAGFVRINDVWCYLLSGPQPAFYFDIAAPTEFSAPDVEPDIAGTRLVELAREAYGIERNQPAPLAAN